MDLPPGEQRAGAGHFVHVPRSRTPAAPARHPQQLSRNHVSARVHHPAARSLVGPLLLPFSLLVASDRAVYWTRMSLQGGQAALGLRGASITAPLQRAGPSPSPTPRFSSAPRLRRTRLARPICSELASLPSCFSTEAKCPEGRTPTGLGEGRTVALRTARRKFERG